MQLDQKLQDYKLSKKMLKAFYGISYPTLRKRLRAAGLEEFIGRRKFLFAEFLLIFKALGQPQEIMQELQELAYLYEQLLALGLLQGQSQKELPQKANIKEEAMNNFSLSTYEGPLALLNKFIDLYYCLYLAGLAALYPNAEEEGQKTLAMAA